MLELYRKIQRSRAKLVGPDGKPQSLPGSLRLGIVRRRLATGGGLSLRLIVERGVGYQSYHHAPTHGRYIRLASLPR